MFTKDKITDIFVVVDDFCKEFSSEIKNIKYSTLPSDKKRRNRASRISDSEIITILIGFHLGSHRTFKHYYQQVVQQHWTDLFPDLVVYNN